MKKYCIAYILLFFLQKSQAQIAGIEVYITKNIVLIGDTFSLVVKGNAYSSSALNITDTKAFIKEPLVLLSSLPAKNINEDGIPKTIYEYKLSCYDSGIVTILPFQVGNTCNNDFTKTDSLQILVNNVAVDMKGDIKEEADEDQKANSSFLKDFWHLLLLAFIILDTAIVYSIWYYKNKNILQPKTKLTPLQQALQDINELQLQSTSETGFNNFYTKLSNSVRSYLQKQLGLPLLYNTSSQYQNLLSTNNFTKPYAQNIAEVSYRADFAKFAQSPPTEQQAIKDKEQLKDILVKVDAEYKVYLKQEQERLKKKL